MHRQSDTGHATRVIDIMRRIRHCCSTWQNTKLLALAYLPELFFFLFPTSLNTVNTKQSKTHDEAFNKRALRSTIHHHQLLFYEDKSLSHCPTESRLVFGRQRSNAQTARRPALSSAEQQCKISGRWTVTWKSPPHPHPLGTSIFI